MLDCAIVLFLTLKHNKTICKHAISDKNVQNTIKVGDAASGVHPQTSEQTGRDHACVSGDTQGWKGMFEHGVASLSSEMSHTAESRACVPPSPRCV